MDAEGKTDTAGQEIKNDENVITGLTLTFSGNNDCPTGVNLKESFQVQVNCPQAILDGSEENKVNNWKPAKFKGYDDRTN